MKEVSLVDEEKSTPEIGTEEGIIFMSLISHYVKFLTLFSSLSLS